MKYNMEITRDTYIDHIIIALIKFPAFVELTRFDHIVFALMKFPASPRMQKPKPTQFKASENNVSTLHFRLEYLVIIYLIIIFQ